MGNIFVPPLDISCVSRACPGCFSQQAEDYDIHSFYEKLISCVIPYKLYVGGDTPCNDHEYLKAIGINTIINLSPESTLYSPPSEIEYYEFDIRDHPSFVIPHSTMHSIFDIIEGPAKNPSKIPDWNKVADGEFSPFRLSRDFDQSVQRVVYLHCQKGVSRSITIAIAYILWRFPGMDVDSSLSMIKCPKNEVQGSHQTSGSSNCRGSIASVPSDNIIHIRYANKVFALALDRPIAQPNAGFTLQLYELKKYWDR
eukprot:CAMPEP_0201527326 /NCGR_PEP_ID=MMETSP0161_2-20130828/34835_1 /ASSEMBLY_ACC=CAM_ASM_000251 /TAXON_ID=180227 /ORGANISM="Neoparamoeba aestuarina, Strain SoJaBio B1-5/56/2" /LENGTH=254 /DNA_ID=CAMNT_0047928115 /DNA_START=110 /DNA_END=874 /DNA_ORIENTATION=-